MMSAAAAVFVILFSILLASVLLWCFVMLIAVTIGLILGLFPRNGKKQQEPCDGSSCPHA